MAASPKTIAFFGATGGCGLSALRRSVAAGHVCIALCRTPSKLEALFPDKPSNLVVREGNAHDAKAVAGCLTSPADQGRLVDAVSFSIGGVVNMGSLSMDDPDVCKKGVAALLDALADLRASWGARGRPLLAVVSTTGISEHGRDVPLLLTPFYRYALHAPHEDKKVAEKRLFASQERFVIVRPSLLTDGEKADKKIRVHVEGPSGIETKEVGYFISRQDVGRWMFDNVLDKADSAVAYEGKAVGLTW
ncbi:NAD(P)H-binding domain-containing protein [Hirsutella rhossiliensis]|uniref:NAD(P)H-binding domain-containing protein n=1 Tax=Hirsutella rhossiliensis TaxID=111463 RepID=A0A9P8MWA4_9HYPO|nr:NAD(P)H-binding domain-containing protein [Hirsutella rhossiliensis]KAH0961406.1 NAD(P)H-binding domain-containing protein [Hirsutella rhossiliensis]